MLGRRNNSPSLPSSGAPRPAGWVARLTTAVWAKAPQAAIGTAQASPQGGNGQAAPQGVAYGDSCGRPARNEGSRLSVTEPEFSRMRALGGQMATNDNQAPEDVEALCSRAQMDTAHYKVFQRPRRPMRTAPAPERGPEPAAPSGMQAVAEEPVTAPPSFTPASFSAILPPTPAIPVFVPPAPNAGSPAAYSNPAAQVLSNPETAFLQNPALSLRSFAAAQSMPGQARSYPPASAPAQVSQQAPSFGSGPVSGFTPEVAFAGFVPGSQATFSPGFAAAIAAATAGAQPQGQPPAGNSPTFSANPAEQYAPPQPQYATPHAPYTASATMPPPYAIPRPAAEIPISELRASAGMPIPMETPGQAAEAVRRRWAMLRGLSADDATDLQTGGGARVRIPVFSIVGLSGGSGRTTTAATLTSALSRMGERVLLVHSIADDLTPCHFGITSSRPGFARTVAPRHQGAGAIYILAYEEAVEESARHASDWLSAQLAGLQGQLDRIIVQTQWKESREATFVALANACIAMLVPDVKCLYRLTAFRRWLAAQQQGLGQPLPVGYLLNKFDPAVTFHADMQQWLRCELGNRLLSFTIRRTDAVTESLGTGTTLIDYSPDAPAVNDFLRLAAWTRDVGIRQLAAKG